VFSLLFVYLLDYGRTRLANDVKSSKKGGSASAAAPRRVGTGMASVVRYSFVALLLHSLLLC
jgi:hypothetical protein